MFDALRHLFTLDTLVTLFMALAALTLAIGLLLLISPPLFERISRPMNTLFSARKALRPLEIPRSTERFFYRHHRIFGAFILLGVGVYFGALAGDTRSQLIGAFSTYLPRGTADWLIPGLLDFFAAANVLIFGVGLVVLFRPSLLKGLELRANRWVSTRRMTRDLARPNEAADSWVVRAPRLVGACVVIGSAYILASFALL